MAPYIVYMLSDVAAKLRPQFVSHHSHWTPQTAMVESIFVYLYVGGISHVHIRRSI